ncbi:MAG: hypothetical protein IPK76_26490 [Lewinellaceae bacterium]|nr:hypothetical protein [Lewinellaceae bacterium]
MFNHFIIYFSEELLSENEEDMIDGHIRFQKLHRFFRHEFSDYLLDHKFTLRNIDKPNFSVQHEIIENDKLEKAKLTIQDIYNYAESLQNSVECWYFLFNLITIMILVMKKRNGWTNLEDWAFQNLRLC